MAYVSGYKRDIFVSYARVDDQRYSGMINGWVTTLIDGLKIELAKRLGRQEIFSLWMDHELPGNVPITSEIMGNLEHSATLVVIFSEGYLASPWCQKEKTRFLQTVQSRVRAGSRVFVIKIDDAEPPGEFGEHLGYCFWTETSPKKHPYPLGFPIPQPDNPTHQEYYNRLIDLSYDLRNELVRLQPPSETSKPTVDDRPTVCLALTEMLSFKREEVKRFLQGIGVRVLPEAFCPFDPLIFQDDLQKSDLFVQLLDFESKSGPTPIALSQSPMYRQFELASRLNKPILQWRSRQLNLQVMPSREYRDFFQHETVVATGLEQFKEEIRARLFPERAVSNALKKRAPSRLVFIKKDDRDLALSEEICQKLKDIFGVRYFNPRASSNPRMIAKKLQQCSGMMLIYGDVDIDWVEEEYDQASETILQRDPPVTFAIYEGPPEQKPNLTFDDPDMLVLKCRNCLQEAELGKFVNALHAGAVL
jgi:hypothetical protein